MARYQRRKIPSRMRTLKYRRNVRGTIRRTVNRKNYPKTKSAIIARQAKVQRPLFSPFPPYKLVRHKYCERITVPGGTVPGQARQFSFRANSTYDPNYSGTGHQPLFRDQMAAQYNRYCVIASYIKVLIPPSNNKTQIWGLIVDDDTSVSQTLETFCETHSYAHSLRADKRNSTLILRKSFDAKREFKTTVKGLLADDAQRISKNDNPGTGVVRYYHLFSGPVLTEQLDDEVVFVEIIYITMWMDPIEPTPS